MSKGVLALLAFSSILMLMVACGGGGGNGGDTIELCYEEWDHWLADHLNPPTSDNLVDTYTLVGFDLDVWENGVYSHYDENIWTASGSMNIQAATITQNILVNGTPINISASYTVTTSGPTSGTFHFVDPYYGNYDAGFVINGNVLTTDSGYSCETIPLSQGVPESLGAGGGGRIGSLPGDMILYWR